MGGQGRKTIITYNSPKRYRKRCTLPKPLPLGEVAPKVTERASPAGKSRRRSDGQALCQSDTIAVSELFGSGLALSVSSPCSSPAPPEGEPLACRSAFVLVQPLSLASLDSSPSRGASGEEAKLCGMPRPPLGRGGGSASALTERLSPELSRLRRD